MASLTSSANAGLPVAELARRRSSATRELYLTRYYFYQHQQAFESAEESQADKGGATSCNTSNSHDCDALCDATCNLQRAQPAGLKGCDQVVSVGAGVGVGADRHQQRKYRDMGEESNADDDEALGLDYAASDGENMPASCVSQLSQVSLALTQGLTCTAQALTDKPTLAARLPASRQTSPGEDYNVAGDNNNNISNKSNSKSDALDRGASSCISSVHVGCLVCARLTHCQQLASESQQVTCLSCSSQLAPDSCKKASDGSASRSLASDCKGSTSVCLVSALEPDASRPVLHPSTQQAPQARSRLTCKPQLRQPQQQQLRVPLQPRREQHQPAASAANSPAPIYSLATSAACSSTEQISLASVNSGQVRNQLTCASRPKSTQRNSSSHQVQARRSSSPTSCSVHTNKASQAHKQHRQLSLEEQLRRLLDLAPAQEDQLDSEKAEVEKHNRSSSDNKLQPRYNIGSAMKKSSPGKLGVAKEQHPSAGQCSHRSRPDANLSPDDRLMIFMLASRSTQTNSTVERNARILKWLNNCRSAA